VFIGDSDADETSPVASSFSSGEQSPVRINAGAAGTEPRRTVSAGATLWRRKQGKGDWEDSADHYRSNTFTSAPPTLDPIGQPSEDDEWDIEQAIERRVVQVMFTVPKEKLRVVNQDVDEDKSDVGSLRSKGGSVKEVHHPETISEKEAEGRDKGKGRVMEVVEKMEGRSRKR